MTTQELIEWCKSRDTNAGHSKFTLLAYRLAALDKAVGVLAEEVAALRYSPDESRHEAAWEKTNADPIAGPAVARAGGK